MFSDLNNFLDIDVGCTLTTGKCILTVEISGANGSFVLHHLLSLALRGDRAVYFLGLAQTFHHYTCIGNKLALNLSRLRDSGKLTFVDGLSLIGNDLVSSSVTTSVPDQTAMEEKDGSEKQLVKQLFVTVKQAIEKLPGYPDVPPVVIVDDLSILTSLGCEEYDVSVFFQYLRTMLCPHGGTIVSLIHAEHNDTQAESRPGTLYRHIGHQSDIIILVRPLKTGYCRDLNGEISVEWTNRSGHGEARQPRAMHYKISDKNVTLFPPGMSAAVL